MRRALVVVNGQSGTGSTPFTLGRHPGHFLCAHIPSPAVPTIFSKGLHWPYCRI